MFCKLYNTLNSQRTYFRWFLKPSNRELYSFEFRNPNKTFYDQHQIVFGVIKQLIMKTKDELGPCWVESQSSVTNDGKDIIEEIIDIRAAPEIF